MAERALFFDSVDGDRIYTAADFSRVWSAIMHEGIVPDEDGSSEPLQVVPTAPESLAVNVTPGQIWIQGRMYELDTDPLNVPLATADTTNPRVDRIVARLDTTARTITIEVLQGTPAAAPTVPAITRTDTVYEMSLAQVWVATNVTQITAANIEDERATEALCGYARTISAAPKSAEGPAADMPPADGSQGVYRTTDANGTWIDIAGTWRPVALLSDNNGGNPLLLVGSSQTNALLRIRNSAQAIEFGHSNPGGYGSAIGATKSSGLPYVVFFGEEGTNNNTFRTRGFPGGGFIGNGNGGFDVFMLGGANADNQNPAIIGTFHNGNGTMSGFTLQDVFDRCAASYAIGGAYNAPWQSYAVLTPTINNNTQFTFSWPTMSTGEVYTVELGIYNPSGFPITWPAEVRWVDGAAPPVDASNFQQFMFQRIYIAGNWRTWGTYVGKRPY